MPEGRPHRADKFDPDTLLETVFSTLAGASLIAAYCVLSLATGGRDSPPRPEYYGYLPVPLALAALFALLRFATDNHYLVAPLRRTLDYRFSFLGMASCRPRLQARDIEAVVVECVEKSTRRSTLLEYCVRVFPKRGGPIQVTKPVRTLFEANERAFELAALLDAPFGPGRESLSWRRDGAGRVAPVFWEDDLVGLKRHSPMTVAFAFALFGCFLIFFVWACNAK